MKNRMWSACAGAVAMLMLLPASQASAQQKSEVTLSRQPGIFYMPSHIMEKNKLIEKHAAIKPFIVHPVSREMETPTGEFLQTPEEREAFSQFTYCIKCGLCLAACPTVATDPLFLGPQALAQAYRYTADNRDCGLQERLEALDVFHGPYQCHLAGACSQACPKGVDPALGIQLLKRTMVLDSIGFSRKQSSVARVSPLADVVKSIEEFAPPPRTVNP